MLCGRLATALVVATALTCAGCGAAHSRSSGSGRALPPATTSAAAGLALGITEGNANLLHSPEVDRGGPFAQGRSELTALQPRYVRLLIDWAALQPHPDDPPDLAAGVSGCARTVGPCGAYDGVRAQLAAIASQQRAAGGGAFQVVIDIFGTPAWAAAQPSGCEPRGTLSFARPLRAPALASYRSLIDELLATAAEEGVALAWWSPWNEPNDSRFMSPERAGCASTAPPVAASSYAQLARAMSDELARAGGQHRLILGELEGLTAGSPDAAGIAQFVAALPESVVCLASAWSVHAYASYGARAAPEPVQALESALDARGGCASHAPIWVTEAGAGAPHAGEPRPRGEQGERESCDAFARQLARWSSDPRIDAVFQYTFREDPDFQVGLVSADLAHVYPAYRLLLRFARARGHDNRSPPLVQAACATAG